MKQFRGIKDADLQAKFKQGDREALIVLRAIIAKRDEIIYFIRIKHMEIRCPEMEIRRPERLKVGDDVVIISHVGNDKLQIWGNNQDTAIRTVKSINWNDEDPEMSSVSIEDSEGVVAEYVIDSVSSNGDYTGGVFAVEQTEVDADFLYFKIKAKIMGEFQVGKTYKLDWDRTGSQDSEISDFIVMGFLFVCIKVGSLGLDYVDIQIELRDESGSFDLLNYKSMVGSLVRDE